MTRRTGIRLAIAAIVIAVVAARGWLRHEEAGGAATSAKGALIEPARDGRGFTLGSLAFAPCELGQPNTAETTAAFCAPFRVPENWDAPDARRIDLRVALVRSDADVAERDLVVLLAGGPGQAATEVYPRAAPGFAGLRRHRNILLVDQRGTGGSHALKCKEDPDDFEDTKTPGQDIDLDRVRERTRECLATLSKDADPAQYTTAAALRDLEAVRQALGGPELDLVGVSYGTRVAQQYLRAYPDAVRSVVLDSAVPNEVILGAEFARNLDDALKADFRACRETPACAKAFGDPYQSLYRLRDALVAKPVEVDARGIRSFEPAKTTINAYTLAGLVRMFAYSAETSALLPLTIHRALAGDYAPLAGESDLIKENLSDLGGNAMQLSVICTEDADLLEPRTEDRGLILGDAFVDVLKAQCAIWPHGTRPDDFHAPVESDKPVLILEGERDPVTPPRYGDAILKGLPNGRMLVAQGQGHSVMARGCFPRLVERFVETLDAAALDAGCVANFGPTPAFIDYNGAAP